MRPDSGFLIRKTWRPDVVLARRLEVSGGPRAAGHARVLIEELLSGRLDPEYLFDVMVLVSEMVTNAVRHGRADAGGTVVVHMALARDVLRIEVCDRGPGFERPDTPRSRTRGGGNGLVLLDRMSSRWGVAVDDGTCVWFELDVSPGGYL